MRLPNICDSCVHLWEGDVDIPLEELFTHPAPRGYCPAFPDGIPFEIWSGRFDHRNAFGTESEQHRDMRWTPDPEAEGTEEEILGRWLTLKNYPPVTD